MTVGQFQRASFLAVVAVMVVLLPSPRQTRAGLSGPPRSYVVPVGEGDKMLVMLSPVPLARDLGDLCKLPTGEEVSLRETFPVSGLYANRTTTPIWAVNWYARPWELKLSKDFRYLARINEFGDGGFGRPGRKLSRGIKFYDAGVEIATHDVEDLVDYPSLMPLTTSDWHLMWYADFKLIEPDSGELFCDVRTSTRDRFRFDARTGELLKDRRFWRNVFRGGIVAASLAGLAGICFVVRRVMAPRRSVAAGPLIPDTNLTFSLRSLLLAVTIVGLCLGGARFAPRSMILLSGLTVCGVLSTALYRTRKRAPWSRISHRAKRRRIGLWIATLGSWLWSYLIFFPAFQATLFMLLPFSWDVRVVTLYLVYAPVLWLHQNYHLFSWAPIDWYLSEWW